MVSVLEAYRGGASLFPSLPSAQSALIDNIRATANERFTKEKEAIDSKAETRTQAIDAEDDRYIMVKAQINNAKIAVDSARESIASIRNMLLELRTTVALAGETGEDSEFRAGEFDAKVAAINGEADTGGRAFNLVGYIDRTDFSPNTVEYRKSLGSASTELLGTYIGHDWRVRANDGTVWVPDLGADSLTQYSELQGVVQKTTLSDGTETDKTVSTRNGLELISYNPSTGAITFEVTIDPSNPPETVTGTLEQEGIGLFGSWFYGKLDTAAGRDAAFKAIEKAEIELTSRETAIEKAAAQVSTDMRKVDEELSRLSQDKVATLTQQIEETEKLQITTAQQIQAMEINLDNLSEQQRTYLNAFAGYVRSPFLRISLTA
ncbi:MAG: hypothetical protein SFV21_12205 [Rhodospirillaceae bacterium]|nr:hypothetical protein [Rhodospirillaceae bacterium]